MLAAAYAIAALALGLLFYKLGLSKKYTRKIVHILVGFEWVILYHFMGNTVHFLVVCVVFTAALAAAHFFRLFPAMTSDGENDPGTVYYGVAMSVMSLICLLVDGRMMIPFGIGVFCTSFGDGLAGVVGQLVRKHNPKIFRKKSLIGTLTNFIVSSFVALVFTNVFSLSLSIWQCFAIGILAAGVELVGVFGLDNVFVTVFTAFLAYGMIYYDGVMNFIIPIIATPFIISTVLHKKALTPWGLVGALVLDLVISLVFMNFGFTVLISFFILSLAIDKVKKLKKREDTITKKEGARDLVQVIANGLIPMVMAMLFAFTVNYAFLVAFVASLAEAFADTAASGIGVYSRSTFDPFRMKRCECGLSGGMSVIGTLAALVGSVLISFIPMLFGVYANNLTPVIISSVAAFLGVLFDSLLGSLLQVKYRCEVCGKITEREGHCNRPTKRVSGFSFFDNDVVNLLSGAFTALVASVVYILVY